LEDSQSSKVKEVETSWKAVIDEKKDNWEAKERSLEEKIENQERLLNELKASYEVAQRLGGGESEDEGRHNSASVAELEIVSSELDRTNQRLAEVEARNEQLRIELAEASSNSQRQAATEEDPNHARLRSENSTLLRKLDNVRLEKDTETRKREARIRVLEKDAQMLERDREGLRERVQSWRDYNEIKQELDIFKVRNEPIPCYDCTLI
jgi:homeobox protein cut-like